MNNTPIFHYPVFLNLKDRPVLVIGGGVVATRKIQTLLQSGAKLTVISPELTPKLIDLGKQHRINIRQRSYRHGDLRGFFLIFTATDHVTVNQAVADEAKKAGICINVADHSAPGDFIVPAMFSEKDFTVAVSTHAQNPALAAATRDRLQNIVKINNAPGNNKMKSDKIMNLGRLQTEIATLKKKGKKVIFTNGCFDLIHVGHVRYLTEARSLGDVLIVAVNSDASVRKIKGEKRPIVSQAQRLEVLSAFWFIDYLILFSGHTPKRLITTLTPDILVKGGDWALDQIVGREHVEAHGGKVVRIKMVKNASTSSLIDRVLARFQQ